MTTTATSARAVETEGRDGAATAFVFGLVVMATWTLVVKYLAPVLHVVAERAAGRSPESVPVMWDFWWAAHLLLARLIWTRHPLARVAALSVTLLEIAIVAVKFVLYVRHPDLSFWRLLWFTNKVYVLAVFTALLIHLLRRPGWPGTAAI